jgi:hypothetical protein
MSNEKKLNDFISKKYIKYLFLLVIIYFIYQKYNLLFFVSILFLIVLFNIDFKHKLKDTDVLDKYITCKKHILDFLKEFKETLIGDEVKQNKNISTENFTNIDTSYDVKPWLDKENFEKKDEKVEKKENDLFNKEHESLNKEHESFNKEHEPFNKEVNEIKELYENIKMEINRLGS